MIIDLRELKRTGKEESDFFFEYTPEYKLADIPNVEMLNPVSVCGTVTLTGQHSAYVEGEIVFTLEGECTRCLSPASKKYSAFFAESIQQGDLEGYPLVNDKIDLTKIVDDAILMALPVNFLCKEDCLGLCQGCGVNLNNEQCKCNKQ
jgi:uncharacterized protein